MLKLHLVTQVHLYLYKVKPLYVDLGLDGMSAMKSMRKISGKIKCFLIKNAIFSVPSFEAVKIEN